MELSGPCHDEAVQKTTRRCSGLAPCRCTPSSVQGYSHTSNGRLELFTPAAPRPQLPPLDRHRLAVPSEPVVIIMAVSGARTAQSHLLLLLVAVCEYSIAVYTHRMMSVRSLTLNPPSPLVQAYSSFFRAYTPSVRAMSRRTASWREKVSLKVTSQFQAPLC